MESDLQTPLGKASGKAAKEWSHPSNHWLRGFILDNRASLGTLAVFIVMMAVFMIANPTVFTTWYLYSSVLTTLPVALFVVVPLVFVVTCGEIDLSFPATMGFASWVFALVVQAGYDPFIGIAAALVTGTLLGFLVGSLVVYGGLSSLIATLGMNFLLRGLIQIINEGRSTALTADRTEVKSAEDLINFMEDVAHPGGLPGLHGEAEQRA